MNRKNLGLNCKYKLSLSASWALEESDHDAMDNGNTRHELDNLQPPNIKSFHIQRSGGAGMQKGAKTIGRIRHKMTTELHIPEENHVHARSARRNLHRGITTP